MSTGSATASPPTKSSAPSTSGQPASGGLKQQWNLTEPPPLGSGTNEKAKKFTDDFKAAMEPVKQCLLYTKVNAEKPKHDAMVSKRDALYGQFPAKLAEINKDESKADAVGKPFLDGARNLGGEANKLKKETEDSVKAWQAKEPAYTKSEQEIEELEKWGDKEFANLRKAGDAIRSATNENKYGEAVKLLDQHLPKLKPVYDEYVKQKAAKEKYEADLKLVQPRLDEALKFAAPETLKAQRDGVLAAQKPMEEAAKEQKFDQAATNLTQLSQKLDEYVKEINKIEQKNPTEWAKQRKGQFQSIKDNVDSGKQALSKDVDGAIGILDEATKAYDAYDKEFKKAKKNFVQGIKEVKEEDQLIKDVQDFGMGQLSGGASALLTPVGATAVKFLSLAGKVITIIDPKTRADKYKENPFDKAKTQDTTKGADYKGLGMDKDVVLKGYKKVNDALDEAMRSVDGEIKWLDTVIADPKAADGQQERMDRTDNLANAKHEFAALQPDLTSQLAPLKTAAGTISKKTALELEQDMAIRWIARLKPEERDYIDKADGYLKTIGVIDKEGNRLGADTGNWTTDHDEKIIHLNAKVEVHMQSLLRQSLLWEGFSGAGNIGIATRSSHRYRVMGPASLRDLAKGSSVICVGIKRPGKDDSKDRADAHYNPTRDNEYMADRIYDHILTVEPGGDADGRRGFEPAPDDD